MTTFTEINGYLQLLDRGCPSTACTVMGLMPQPGDFIYDKTSGATFQVQPDGSRAVVQPPPRAFSMRTASSGKISRIEGSP
jgi:hypothetical protein